MFNIMAPCLSINNNTIRKDVCSLFTQKLNRIYGARQPEVPVDILIALKLVNELHINMSHNRWITFIDGNSIGNSI